MAATTGSAVLKRLAFLNRSGVLAKPLQYSQVKGSLTALGEEAALQILQDLEDEAASVPDPIAYVKDAAAKASGSQPFAPPSAMKRKLDQGDDAGTGDDNSMLAKRIRLMNNSGQLAQPIAYNRVKEALSSLGVGQAMVILKGLADVADEVPDPTAYIRTAVRGAGGVVQEDLLEDMAEADPAEEMAGAVVEEPMAATPWQRSKVEAGRTWVKGEAITEADKIARRVGWLNRNAGLRNRIDFDDVLPALDSIGFKQAMRLLHRVQENGSNEEDPSEFIKDLVARCGWIWSKPDIIDDDEKVAKRVSWMNLFAGLQQPINYAEVADMLDGLKVPHAMVLLRELEVQAHRIEDPTDHIRKAVTLAGSDNVTCPVVDEDSSVAQHISSLNDTGRLAKPIVLLDVVEDLQKIGEEAAMQLLQELEGKGSSVKNPTAFIKFKLKAKLASMGTTLEDTVDDETKILKRIEWLNDYGGLMQDIDYNIVAGALGAVGLSHAMTVMKELEDNKASVEDPNSFILSSVTPDAPRTQRVQPRPATPKPQAPATGAADVKTIAGFVGFLNKNSKLKKPIKFAEVASALDALGPQRAVRVLKEMQDRGLGLDDPVTYIRAAAQRAKAVAAAQAADEGDDVAKLTKRLKWLNQFAGLHRKINIDEVVGALYCLGLPQSMAILRDLQERGPRVTDPTSHIKVAIQRANGLRVDPALLAKEEMHGDRDAEEEEAEEDDDGAIEEFEMPAEEEDDEGGQAVMDGYEDATMEEEQAVEQDDYGYGDMGEEPAEEFAQEEMEPAPVVRQPPRAPKPVAGQKRVVGALTGYSQLVPKRAQDTTKKPGQGSMVKSEFFEEEKEAAPVPEPTLPSKPYSLPITPQEKLIQIKNLAEKHGLQLDQLCMKSLARLPFFKAKDMIDDVLLGGRDRKGVRNPSRYLTIGCQKMTSGLGVEQGIAMELAVSLGVVLNNDCLDELACIPRKQSQAIIREIAENEEARTEPIKFIMTEVMKCRAQMDARPWGATN
mmetsp:Transcript_44556/g.85686  ORF Transcript_44556/g.85686 Transcript_44556/m.85686 type:complete len:1006 (-) Transcript_44556:63-3080(-)